MRTEKSAYNDAPSHVVKFDAVGTGIDLRAYSRPNVDPEDVESGYACWSIEVGAAVDVVLLLDGGAEVTIPAAHWTVGVPKLVAAIQILDEGTADGPSDGDSTGVTDFVVAYRNQ